VRGFVVGKLGRQKIRGGPSCHRPRLICPVNHAPSLSAQSSFNCVY